MTIQIAREFIPESNDNARAYHTRFEMVTGVPGIRISRYEGVPAQAGPCPVAELVLEVPGVTDIIVMPYTIVVSKAKQFDWKEIEPSLLRILSSFTLPLDSVMKEEEKGVTSRRSKKA